VSNDNDILLYASYLAIFYIGYRSTHYGEFRLCFNTSKCAIRSGQAYNQERKFNVQAWCSFQI